MSTKRLRAVREHWYDTKTRKIGEEYDAPESEARILVGIEKAEYVDQPAKPTAKAPPPAAPKMQTADVKADEPTSAQPMTTDSAEGIVGDTRRRRYSRRDMTPKE